MINYLQIKEKDFLKTISNYKKINLTNEIAINSSLFVCLIFMIFVFAVPNTIDKNFNEQKVKFIESANKIIIPENLKELDLMANKNNINKKDMEEINNIYYFTILNAKNKDSLIPFTFDYFNVAMSLIHTSYLILLFFVLSVTFSIIFSDMINAYRKKYELLFFKIPVLSKDEFLDITKDNIVIAKYCDVNMKNKKNNVQKNVFNYNNIFYVLKNGDIVAVRNNEDIEFNDIKLTKDLRI